MKDTIFTIGQIALIVIVTSVMAFMGYAILDIVSPDESEAEISLYFKITLALIFGIGGFVISTMLAFLIEGPTYKGDE